MTAAPAPHPRLAGLCRPLVLGAAVGHPSGWGGSLGAFVRLADGRAGFVSTAFAIAPPDGRPGDFIHQPGPADTPTLTGATRVALLERVAAATPGAPARMDAALAVLLPGIAIAGNVVPEGFPAAGLVLRPPLPHEEMLAGTPVCMIGRTSGSAMGEIVGLEVSMRMQAHAASRKPATYQFEGLIEIAGGGPFSRAGDGGALVWRRTDGAALGLLVGGDERGASYVIPLTAVLAALGVAWLAETVPAAA